MRKFIFSIILTLSTLSAFAQNAQQKEAFQTFLNLFSDSTAVAYVDVGNQPLMLVSHETFGAESSDQLQAIAATICTLDAKGKIVCLGSIRSQGTLYPVSILDGKLMTAGHEFVNVYEVKGNPADLYLDRTDGGKKLTDMFKKFEHSTPILFKKK